MKRRLSSIALSLLLALSLLPMTALAAEGDSYLALGDSITVGTGLGEGEKSFADVLVETGGYTVVNEAVNGNTAAGILGQLADNALDESIAAADLVTITCGGNDMMALLYEQIAVAYNAAGAEIVAADVVAIMANAEDARRTPLLMSAQAVLNGSEEAGTPAFADGEIFAAALAKFTVDLNDIVAYVRELNPEAVVIVTTQYNPYKAFTGLLAPLNAGVGAGAKKLSDAITANAETGGYLVADVYAAFEASGENLSNATAEPLYLDFHPNAAGHAVIAQCVQTVIDGLSDADTETGAETDTETGAETDSGTVTDACAAYEDIDMEKPYHADLDAVISAGIMPGVDETHFAPEDAADRATIATILWLMEGAPVAETDMPFTDVAGDAAYAAAVNWAASVGIVEGHGDGIFAPANGVTREQLAAMLYRYAVHKGIDVSAGENTNVLSFTDAFDISEYAYPAIQWISTLGIISVGEDGAIAPQGAVMRWEVAQIVAAFALK